MHTPRKTRMIATMGPSLEKREVLEELFNAGIDCFRINCSHGSHESIIKACESIREISINKSKPVGILFDLQGPKIRIGKIGHKLELKTNDYIYLHLENEFYQIDNVAYIPLEYKPLIEDIDIDQVLTFDDGKIKAKVVQKIEKKQIKLQILNDGYLSDRKGINILGGGLSAPALTIKDFEDMKLASELKADFIALSFVKDEDDIKQARSMLKTLGSDALIISKIERVEACKNLDSILDLSDGVMVARGDLALEIGDASVPAMQKKIINKANNLGKISIVATQMFESMISSPVPTRAEISDCANAVWDGASATMFSAETASGKFPIQAANAMHRALKAAEDSVEFNSEKYTTGLIYANASLAVASSALFAAKSSNAKLIAVFTTSGKTAREISRFESKVPILALAHSFDTLCKLALSKGVIPVAFKCVDKSFIPNFEVLKQIIIDGKIAKIGDEIVCVYGEPMGETGSTDTLRFMKI